MALFYTCSFVFIDNQHFCDQKCMSISLCYCCGNLWIRFPEAVYNNGHPKWLKDRGKTLLFLCSNNSNREVSTGRRISGRYRRQFPRLWHRKIPRLLSSSVAKVQLFLRQLYLQFSHCSNSWLSLLLSVSKPWVSGEVLKEMRENKIT